MLKNPFKRNNLSDRQRRLIQDLEGVGDILVFQTKRKKNKDVIAGLKRLQEIVKLLFSIQEKDPEQFERLILAQEFFDLQQQNKAEAEFGLALDPEKYLVSFTTAIDQIIRIHEAAIESKNPEVSRLAAYHLVWLLKDFSSSKDKGLFVKQLLYHLSRVARHAAKYEDVSQDSSAVHWYTDIVFNRYEKDKEFKLDYLETFDKNFFASIKYIVKENYFKLFGEFVRHMVNGFILPSVTDADAWTYSHLVSNLDFNLYSVADREHGIEKLTQELSETVRSIDSKEALDSWLNKFAELKAVFGAYLNDQQKDSIRAKEEEIREAAVAFYKYNNLLEMIFAIGAYSLCLSYGLSENREGYLRFLWEFKQPRDSHASWIGHNVIPVTFGEAIDFYFRKSLFERKFGFSEDHHGHEIYYKQYFVLLLAKTLQGIKSQNNEYPQFDAYKLPQLSVHSLSDIEYSVDGLITIANDLKDKKDSLKSLGFEEGQIEETFKRKLIPLLVKLKEKATERISLIHQEQAASPAKVKEFMQQVLSAYKKSHKTRDILKFYELYEDHSTEPYSGSVSPFGINTVDDKAIFFEEWNVHFGQWGDNYGDDLARGENNKIIKVVKDAATEVADKEIDLILTEENSLENIFILATNGAIFSFFRNKATFKSKWNKDAQKVDLDAFEGWYEFNDVKIPVFETYDQSRDRRVFVFNKNKLGKLIQYSPLDTGDQGEFQKDIFFMKAKPFSEYPELLESYLAKPPSWLSEVGDQEAQKKHLLERVLIHINERFELVKNEDFQAYLIKVTD